MKKRNFIPWRLVLVLAAVAVTMTLMGTAHAQFPWSQTYCLGHSITESTDPFAPFGAKFPLSVTFTWLDPLTYRVTALTPNFLDLGVTVFTAGFGLVSDSTLISTLTTATAPESFTSTPPAFAVVGSYQCNMTLKCGKPSLPGAFWFVGSYAEPPGTAPVAVSYVGYYTSVTPGPCE